MSILLFKWCCDRQLNLQRRVEWLIHILEKSSYHLNQDAFYIAVQYLKYEWQKYYRQFERVTNHDFFIPQSTFQPKFKRRFFKHIQLKNMFTNKTFLHYFIVLPEQHWPLFNELINKFNKSTSITLISDASQLQRPYLIHYPSINMKQQINYEKFLLNFPIEQIKLILNSYITNVKSYYLNKLQLNATCQEY